MAAFINWRCSNARDVGRKIMTTKTFEQAVERNEVFHIQETTRVINIDLWIDRDSGLSLSSDEVEFIRENMHLGLDKLKSLLSTHWIDVQRIYRYRVQKRIR